MKLGKNIIVFVAAASFGLSMSAMAQGRPSSHPGGGPGGMGTPGMGGPGMGGQSGMGQPGSMGRSGQMGQNGQMGTQSGPKSASQLLTNNTKLASNLARVLGVDSTTLMNDASGFKNLGLFVAAYHVSKNLNIPFNTLSQTMASDGGNLGKAIHTLQPNLSKKQVKQSVSTAKHQSKADIKQSKS
jgi:hypothetical protein